MPRAAARRHGAGWAPAPIPPGRPGTDHDPVAGAAQIDVLVVDDHPALRAGLRGLLAGEPDLRCVATAVSSRDLLRTLEDTDVDVVVLDYAMGDRDGLATCFTLKQIPDPPAVVMYTAYADRVFAVPATIAQADAVVSKTAPVGDLLDAIRLAARGEATMPDLDPELVSAASARVLAEDLTVAGMLMGAVPVGQIAEILDLPADAVRQRAQRILSRLQADAGDGAALEAPLAAH